MNKEYELFGRKLAGETLLSGILIVFAVVIIFSVVIPQIQGIGLQREQNSLRRTNVIKLQSSLSALESISDTRLVSDVEVLNAALPTNKDVISIFSSIISLATDVGIQVRGFTIQVGDIYDVENETAKADTYSETGYPSMNVVLSLSSTGQSQIVEFTKRLYASFPIAKVNTVASQDGNSSMEISFFYRPYDIDILQNSDEVPGYTNETLNMLDTLHKTQNK